MGFFRRKKPGAAQQPADSVPAPRQVPEQEVEPVMNDDGATPASPTLDASALTPEERANELDKLADEAQGRGEIDQAIAYYEGSLAAMERFGPAYNGLLTLYNTKLSASAHAKDNAAIEGWTSKLDQLMDLSKRIMRSKY